MELRPYQRDILRAIEARYFDAGQNRLLVQAATGCHARGQGIILFNGRISRVEDIEVGDRLMGPDNLPRQVLALARGTSEMVEIVPVKGAPWIVNLDHILTLQRTNKVARDLSVRPRSDCKDGEVIDVSVREWLGWSRTNKHVYKLIRRPADFASQPVEIDPYILGLLLGDGTLAANFGFTNIDAEPLEAMRSYAAANGLTLQQQAPPREATFVFRSVIAWERSPLTIAMRRLRLLPIQGANRFVPSHYKRNSRSVRLEMLAGLIDSDGSYVDGGYEYSTISKRLSDDVAFIARSLGLAAYVKERTTRSQNGTACESFRVHISGDCSVVPCRVPRKRASQRKQKKDVLKTGFAVRPVGTGDYFGFELTGDGRYLLDDFTVTHNTGKTVAFAALPMSPRIRAWLNTFDRRERGMLIIAHREEIIDQAAEKIHRANPDLIVGVEQGGRYAGWTSDVVVASIQTLTSQKCARLKRLMDRQKFRIVIADEAHHAAAPSWRTALAHLGFLPMADASDSEDAEAASFEDVAVMEAALKDWDAHRPKGQVLVGFTATPNRTDAVGLGAVFQTIAFEYGIKPAIDDGWLVPVTSWSVETRTSLEDVRINRGDFNQKELGEAVNDAKRNELAVSSWLRYAKDRPTLAFTVNVAHARDLALAFNRAAVPAAALSGDTPTYERSSILEGFRSGRIAVIANCMILTEGTDLPMASCIVHAKPTKSSTLYIQMSGRGLRLHPDKADCVLIDLVDVSRRHQLQTANVLYGLPPSLALKGLTLGQAQARWDALQEKHPGFNVTSDRPKTLEELEALAVKVDLWSVRRMDDYHHVVRLGWTRTGDTSFRLQYPWEGGTETVTVEPDLLGRFSVLVTARMPVPDRAPVVAPVKTVAQGVPGAAEALRMAEAYVEQERSSASRLKDRSAPWMRRPASEKQLALLRKFHAPVKPGLTAGEASQLIDMAMSRKR